jgi:triosephosphate isomerase
MSKISYPLILINFKTYEKGSGVKALELAKISERVMKETGVCIAVAVQATDIYRIASEVGIPVFAQHIDPITYGSNTGKILIQAIKEAGATGTIINHSECQIKLSAIERINELAKENGLYTCICANNPQVAGAIAALEPDACATEPPELIGSGISVSSAKPEVITNTVKIIQKINPKVTPLCGAGITKREDVATSIKLGTKGILIASGIVKAEKPKEVLESMAKAALEEMKK